MKECKVEFTEKNLRFAAVRMLKETITEGKLFPIYICDCFCYVTNENLSPRKAHRSCGKRAAGENWIEWCKNQSSAGSVLTNTFRANSAIFQTCIFAYNLMVRMMRLTQNQKINEEPSTSCIRVYDDTDRKKSDCLYETDCYKKICAN